MEPQSLTNSTGSNSTNCSSIDDFRNQVYSISYTIITLLGLTGNGLALVVLIKTNRQSSPFHVYMINLVVADLLCVMTLPLRIIYYVRKGHWSMGNFLCVFSSYALYVNLYCSIYFMVAMSFTRFLAIVYPVKNLQLMTVNRARQVCVGIWVFICLLSSPFLMSGQYVDSNTNTTKCFDAPPGKIGDKLKVLNYLSLVIGFVLPLLVILLCYAGIIHTLLSRSQLSRTLSAQQQQRAMGTKAIRMIVIVLLTFTISFMPYHVLRTVFLSRDHSNCSERIQMHKSVVVTLCLAAANTCFDPLLYYFSGEGFRSRFFSCATRSQPQNLKETTRKSVNSQQTGGRQTSKSGYVTGQSSG
ncbi:cysteinyl leukotriene receptor 1 [Hippoglossus hippoglossus]|uniref:cysteinyl leukotriene receptor 1 n=1 Tax=Hippoglossus hippoglossus TaxID=8267 RepID=UPI00148E8EAE|nr:cysteinyl leukotriene receptor 1 [Hippoglossus hippoglossus]XP_034454208.1 cysteinyl leukotriene receptor 1 [Hippoglossus hippoglossus]XP_034454209.1 cysteinyl leukotriene receptor 1 [Hippoglossus hippoglossus]